MKSVSSRDNPLIKRLRALSESARARRDSGQTLLDGAHLLRAALESGIQPVELLVSEQGLARDEIVSLLDDCATIRTTCVPDALFAQISPVDTPSGLIAVIEIPPPPADQVLTDSLIVLDGVQDPGNLGTILRTAAAAGLQDVLLTTGCAQAWSPRVLRAGMGGHFRLRIREQSDVATHLRDFPGAILATGLGPGALPLYGLKLVGPIAWLFGSEGSGLSHEIAALANGHVLIPMPGEVESLNVGAAVAVCLFEQVRQKLS